MGRWIAAMLGILVAAGAVWAGIGLVDQRTDRDPLAGAAEVADAYAAAWSARDYATMATLLERVPEGFEDGYDAVDEQLALTGIAVVAARPTITSDAGNEAAARLDVRLDVPGIGAWSYDALLELVRGGGEWTVRWSSDALHPRWRLGDRFSVEITEPVRGALLDHAERPLTLAGEVYDVGIQPSRVTDPELVVTAFEVETDADPEKVRRLLARSDLRPDWFYPVIRMRADEYERVWPRIRPVPGIVRQVQTGRFAVDDDLAAHVLGRTGLITAELLDELGAGYAEGDTVGLSGLERVFETELAGNAQGRIVLLGPSGAVTDELFVTDGAPPLDIVTTLDLNVQRAAESALDEVDLPAAIVVVDTATGGIRAVANRPVDGFDRALTGLYPPGSSFKVVTAAAALLGGATVDDTIACPGSATFGGLRIDNAGSFDLGDTPVSTAFARSCNTSFAQLAVDAGGSALGAAAARFGFDVAYTLPLPVAGARFPEPADTAEIAAAAIGQARVLASPVHMATVAAAAMSGTWRAPSLLGPDQAGVPTTDPAPTGDPLPQLVRDDLRTLLRRVITAGTGTAADVPDTTVYGKTGSAEFRPEGFGGGELPTHAWFIGAADDLAFAIIVEGGGGGGTVAAPIAARLVAGFPRT